MMLHKSIIIIFNSVRIIGIHESVDRSSLALILAEARLQHEY